MSTSKVPSNVASVSGITVQSVRSRAVSVKGSAKGTAKVYVKAGSKTLGSAKTAADGSFSVKIKKQKKNTKPVSYTHLDVYKRQILSASGLLLYLLFVMKRQKFSKIL